MDLSLFLSLEERTTTGMTVFQMENFVISDQLTVYRKLRQAVIETRARLESITLIGFDLEELQIKKDKTQLEIAATDIEIRIKTLAIKRNDFEIDRKTRLLNQVNEELEFFINTINAIVSVNFASITVAVDTYGSKAYNDAGEANFWMEKLARSVFSDLVNYGTISKGVLESITCLDTEICNKILCAALEMNIKFQIKLGNEKDKALCMLD